MHPIHKKDENTEDALELEHQKVNFLTDNSKWEEKLADLEINLADDDSASTAARTAQFRMHFIAAV